MTSCEINKKLLQLEQEDKDNMNKVREKASEERDKQRKEYTRKRLILNAEAIRISFKEAHLETTFHNLLTYMVYYNDYHKHRSDVRPIDFSKEALDECPNLKRLPLYEAINPGEE